MKYAQSTIVNIAQTMGDIKDLVEKNSGSITAIKEEPRQGMVEFVIQGLPVRFTLNYDTMGHAYGSDAFEQAKKAMWRSLLLLIKAKLVSVENKIETLQQAFFAAIIQKDNRVASDAFLPMVMQNALVPAVSAKTPIPSEKLSGWKLTKPA